MLAVTVTAEWTLVALALLAATGPDWSLYAPATCLGTHCFCEAPRAGTMLMQPANSLSSLGFVLVGAWIMLDGENGKQRALGRWPTLWLGLTAIFIGLGSVMLHATLTLWGQFADVLGMYLLGSFTLVWALARWRGLSARSAVIAYVAIAGSLTALLWIAPETRRWLFAVLLVTAIAVEWFLARPRRPAVQSRLLLAGLAANIAAFALWVPDQMRTLCAPESLWQGHAAWHLLGAAAVALSFAYYRSERAPPM
ncbi:MAG: ceramidase domain-containing protein [Polymorphobacter sp.]